MLESGVEFVLDFGTVFMTLGLFFDPWFICDTIRTVNKKYMVL